MTSDETRPTLPFVKCTNRHPMFITAEWVDKVEHILVANNFKCEKDISCVGKQRKNRGGATGDAKSPPPTEDAGQDAAAATPTSIVSVEFKGFLYARTHTYCEDSYRIEMHFLGEWSRRLLTLFFGDERNTFFLNSFDGTEQLIAMMAAAQHLYDTIQILSDNLEAYIDDLRGTLAYDRTPTTGRYVLKSDFTRAICGIRSDLDICTGQLVQTLLCARKHVLETMQYAVRADTLFPLYEQKRHLTPYDFIECGRATLYEKKLPSHIAKSLSASADNGVVPPTPATRPAKSSKKKQHATLANANDEQELPSSDNEGDAPSTTPLNGTRREDPRSPSTSSKRANDAFLVYRQNGEASSTYLVSGKHAVAAAAAIDDDDYDVEPTLDVDDAAEANHHQRHFNDPAILAMSPPPPPVSPAHYMLNQHPPPSTEVVGMAPPPRPASTSATHTTPFAQFVAAPHQHGCTCDMCIQIHNYNMTIAHTVSSQYDRQAHAYNQRAQHASPVSSE